MKKLFVILPLCLLATALASAEGSYLIPSNAPVTVTLGWDASPSIGLSGYNIYYGVTPRGYTNRVSFGLVTQCTISNLMRGVTYYFTATAFDPTGESDFCNEVGYAVPPRPLPPGNLERTNALVSLRLESSPSPTGPWAVLANVDSWPVTPITKTFYRSRVDIRAIPTLPPVPGR